MKYNSTSSFPAHSLIRKFLFNSQQWSTSGREKFIIQPSAAGEKFWFMEFIALPYFGGFRWRWFTIRKSRHWTIHCDVDFNFVNGKIQLYRSAHPKRFLKYVIDSGWNYCLIRGQLRSTKFIRVRRTAFYWAEPETPDWTRSPRTECEVTQPLTSERGRFGEVGVFAAPFPYLGAKITVTKFALVLKITRARIVLVALIIFVPDHLTRAIFFRWCSRRVLKNTTRWQRSVELSFYFANTPLYTGRRPLIPTHSFCYLA